MSSAKPASIDATVELLKNGEYIADRSLATVLYLALKLGRPLFCEGEAGVGKTEIAKVLAATLKRPLIRLQCYEGLDVSSAVYEWNLRPPDDRDSPGRSAGRARSQPARVRTSSTSAS
jgi:MoxR-like ATPase